MTSLENKSRGRNVLLWTVLALVLVAGALACGRFITRGGGFRNPAPAPASGTTLLDYIRAHGGDANRYVNPLLPWKYRDDGSLYENTAEVMAAGGPMAGAFPDIPERLDHARVAECYGKDLYRGFVATILWGGMSRNAPYRETFKQVAQLDPQEVVPKLERLRKMLEKNRTGEALASMACDPATGAGNENHIPGIAENYASKILFFLAYGLPTTPRPLIYNKYLACTHCALIPDAERRARYYTWDAAEGRLVSNITRPELAAEIYVDYCTLLADLAAECGVGDAGLFVEWLHDCPSDPADGEDNPRTLSRREALEKLRGRRAAGNRAEPQNRLTVPWAPPEIVSRSLENSPPGVAGRRGGRRRVRRRTRFRLRRGRGGRA
jgi:hypothetical protein